MTSATQRSPKGQETRDRLLASARATFQARGFSSTRVADIAQHAGVAHGTFYTYFDSKHDVFHAALLEVRDEVVHLQDVGPIWEVSPLQIIRRATASYLSFYQRNIGMMTLLEQVAIHDEQFRDVRLEMRRAVAERAQSFIRHLQRSGVADPSLDARYVATALTGMVDRFAFVWLALGEDFDEDQAVETLARLWCAAIIGCRAEPDGTD